MTVKPTTKAPIRGLAKPSRIIPPTRLSVAIYSSHRSRFGIRCRTRIVRSPTRVANRAESAYRLGPRWHVLRGRDSDSVDRVRHFEELVLSRGRGLTADHHRPLVAHHFVAVALDRAASSCDARVVADVADVTPELSELACLALYGAIRLRELAPDGNHSEAGEHAVQRADSRHERANAAYVRVWARR